MKVPESEIGRCAHRVDGLHPRCQVEDLATPYLRGEAELRGEGRDCLEPVRRRVNPTSPTPRNGNRLALVRRGSPWLLARCAEVELIVRVHVQDLDGRPTDGGFCR